MSIFDTIKVHRPKRSTFDLTHDVKLTANFGKLIPFICEEVVPGDTWYNKSDVLVRFSPLIAPVMHRMYVTTHFFYVPFRLLWKDYEDFETGGKDGKQQPSFPFMAVKNSKTDAMGMWKHGTLADYLNYPTSEENTFNGAPFYVSQLPFRAYQMIYNEYYRDENLEEEIDIPLKSGILSDQDPLYIEMLTLRQRAWKKDYFTSALPWPQKGDASAVPLVGTGSISDPQFRLKSLQGSSKLVNSTASSVSDAMSDGSGYIKTKDSATSGNIIVDNTSNLTMDADVLLKNAGITINDLRRSIRVQRLAEAKARGGSRLKEYLLSVFGVDNEDLRINRPAFLGGSNTPVNVTDVVQTSETTQSSPQGQYAGLAYSVGGDNGWKRTFKERGYIIGIMSVMPECGYVEGCPRGYRKFDPLDFFVPQFADLGEQPIYNYELALKDSPSSTSPTPDGEFGYAPRYAEYKYIPNRVHGDFKDMKSYGFWTLNRYFKNWPTLSQQFITCDAKLDDLNRIFAVEDDSVPKMLVQIVNHTKARRPMPYLPDPTI